MKLNALQLKTLGILQMLARSADHADPADALGQVRIRSLPHAHGDHLHVGDAVVPARDASGLTNPAVYGALGRKGLVVPGPQGEPMLTAEGLSYNTGLAEAMAHTADH
jgi:hypothetical protein